MLLFINAVFFIVLGPQINFTVRVFGILIWIVHSSSYWYIALSNPGIPSFENKFKAQNNEEGVCYKHCPKCQLYYSLSSGTNHCKECDACIEGRYCFNILFFFQKNGIIIAHGLQNALVRET